MLMRGTVRSALVVGHRVPVMATAGTRRHESVAAAAWKKSVANKLDSTMHDGSHDMKAFGLGFLRSLASRQEQAVFKVIMWNVYTAMEDSFDAVAQQKGEDGAGIRELWGRFGSDLRRKAALRADLELLGVDPDDRIATAPSPATQAYVDQIKRVEVEDADLLIGHLYTRYFADLFGGSMQGFPIRLALGLGTDLRFYTFPETVEGDKRAYIERLYEGINEVSEGFERSKKAAIVQEARGAFKHNANAYTERPSLALTAGVGAVRCGVGLAYGAAVKREDMREWCMKLGVLKPAAKGAPAA